MYRKFIELINGLYLKVRSIHSIYLIFFLILATAYLPMLSFQMSLKNDALTLSYPLFYFFSEQVRQGIIPWWHPNLHLGFPLHAEPGFPFFNPITWVWALAGSNLYIFTLMLWSYMLIAGAGMIKLTRSLGFSITTQIFISLSYLLSGYYVSHLQHPHYLFEAAFIPFCLVFTLKMIYSPGWRPAVYLAISFFFLINSGYPSFVLSTGYFLLLLTVFIFLADRSLRSKRVLKKFVVYSLACAVISILLSLPYIVSIIDIYPLFNRIGALSLNWNANTGGMTLRSLMSLVFPLASVTEPAYFGTDITLNNVYTGLFTFIFFIAGIAESKNRLKIPFLLAGLILLALSLQGPIKILYYRFIPFYSLVFTNGGFRIYFMLTVMIIAGWGLDAFLQSNGNRLTRIAGYCIAGLFVASILYCLLNGPGKETSASLVERIRNLSFPNALLIQSLISLTLLGIARLCWKNKRTIVMIGIFEMMLAFWINLPFTGLGLSATASVQKHIDEVISARKSDDFYTTIAEISRHDISDRVIREPLFYSKAIGRISLSSYPSGFRSFYDFEKIYGPTAIANQKIVFSLAAYHHPSPDDPLALSNLLIRAGSISFTATSGIDSDTLVVLQNNSRYWNYQVNGKNVTPITVMKTFTGIPAGKGTSFVAGQYRPVKVIVCFAISTFAWALIFILPAIRKRKII